MERARCSRAPREIVGTRFSRRNGWNRRLDPTRGVHRFQSSKPPAHPPMAAPSPLIPRHETHSTRRARGGRTAVVVDAPARPSSSEPRHTEVDARGPAGVKKSARGMKIMARETALSSFKPKSAHQEPCGQGPRPVIVEALCPSQHATNIAVVRARVAAPRLPCRMDATTRSEMHARLTGCTMITRTPAANKVPVRNIAHNSDSGTNP